VQPVTARTKMATTMDTKKAIPRVKKRVRKTAIDMAAEKPSQKFLPPPMIPDGPNTIKIITTKVTTKDILTVTMVTDIHA